jgi:hypothetical protein
MESLVQLSLLERQGELGLPLVDSLAVATAFARDVIATKPALVTVACTNVEISVDVAVERSWGSMQNASSITSRSRGWR